MVDRDFLLFDRRQFRFFRFDFRESARFFQNLDFLFDVFGFVVRQFQNLVNVFHCLIVISAPRFEVGDCQIKLRHFRLIDDGGAIVFYRGFVIFIRRIDPRQHDVPAIIFEGFGGKFFIIAD